jgi:flagellar hook-associated protein 2
MSATVVNDGTGSDTPWKLLLSLKETGEGQKAEFPYLYFVDGEDDFF